MFISILLLFMFSLLVHYYYTYYYGRNGRLINFIPESLGDPIAGNTFQCFISAGKYEISYLLTLIVKRPVIHAYIKTKVKFIKLCALERIYQKYPQADYIS